MTEKDFQVKISEKARLLTKHSDDSTSIKAQYLVTLAFAASLLPPNVNQKPPKKNFVPSTKSINFLSG